MTPPERLRAIADRFDAMTGRDPANEQKMQDIADELFHIAMCLSDSLADYRSRAAKKRSAT